MLKLKERDDLIKITGPKANYYALDLGHDGHNVFVIMDSSKVMLRERIYCELCNKFFYESLS